MIPTPRVGDVKAGSTPVKSATADDVTAASFTPRRTPNVGSDVLTPPASMGFAPPLTPNDSTGSVDFGPRYRVERLLGQGGMGAVYLAYDQDLGRQVALKLVRPELMVYPGAMERFRQELLQASKVSHRNILRIHDLGDAGGMKFISMAYVDGEDLHHLLLREGKLPFDRMLNITRQLCAALEAAHAEGVVHRDPKRRNAGHAALHGSGAGGSQACGCSHRHLRAGADRLRDGDGRRPVYGRVDVAIDVQARARDSAGAEDSRS